MLMTDILAQIVLYLDGNIFLVSILLTIGLNLFVPGSLVIIFFVGMYGLFLGSIYSCVVLLLGSTIPYVLINVFNLSPNGYLKSVKVKKFFQSATKMPTQNAFLIRLTSIPYLLQNVLCSIIQPSYTNYLVINFLSLIPWLIGFGLFAESVRELKFEFLIASVLFIGLLILLTQRHVKKIS